MPGVPDPSRPAAVASAPRCTRHSLFRLSLHTEERIDASDADVWAVLTGFDAYPEWNPAIPEVVGEARVGAPLDVIIEWPGLRRNRYRLEVTGVRPLRELRWLGRFGMAGLMDGDHRFVIEACADGGVRLVQAEDFSGLLIPLFAPWLRRNVLRGFEAVNAAVKRRAEALVAVGPGDRPRHDPLS